MSALKHVTDAAHEIAKERLTSIRERAQALLNEIEEVRVECKRLSPDLSKEAEDVWGALNKAVQGLGEKAQNGGRPPNESEGESVDEGHLKEVKKARTA